MTDRLSLYFERELALLRKSTQRFVHNHPKASQGMRLNEEYYEDPNITRLLESVALLSARSHQQIDQQLPHISSALSSILFPSQNMTLPAVVSAEFLPDEENFADPVYISKGERFTAMNQQQQQCTFSLCHDMVLSPVQLKNICAYTPPFPFDIQTLDQANAAIVLTMETLQEETEIKTAVPHILDIYVKGFGKKTSALKDLLLSQLSKIVISDADYSSVTVLNADQLEPEVTNPEFRVLPEHQNESAPYVMLLEYLNIPEKSKFFKIPDFKSACQQIEGRSLTITLLFNEMPIDYVRLIDRETFSINTCLLVNAFETRSEPIAYNHQSLSEPILSESSLDEDCELLVVTDLVEVTPEGEQQAHALFKQSFFTPSNAAKWHAERIFDKEADDEPVSFRLFITEVDANLDALSPQLFSAKLLCGNGLAPSTIPSGNALVPEGDIELPGKLTLLQTPSVALAAQEEQQHQWQFIELLSNNFSNLLNVSDPMRKLQQMLAVFCRSTAPLSLIQAIQSVKYTAAISRLNIEGKTVFTPGTRIDITISQPATVNRFSYRLFLHLLNGFFGEFCSFDRFVELHVDVLGSQGREQISFERIQGAQQCL